MMFFRTSLKRSIFAPKRALETKILRKGAGILLTYDLSQRGGTPLYEYLYSQIRQDIIDGILQAGERLPSKRDLARHLGVGVITVANAYDQLLMEGFIRSEERRGFFVENVSGYRRKPPKPVAPKEEPPKSPMKNSSPTSRPIAVVCLTSPPPFGAATCARPFRCPPTTC